MEVLKELLQSINIMKNFLSQTSLLEAILSIFLLWNLVFVGLSISFGLFSNLFIFWFFFSYLSIFFVAFFVVFVLTRFLSSRKKFVRVLSYGKSLYLLCTLSAVLVSLIIAFCTRITAGWDIWALWLPLTKSITIRGDLRFNEYFMSEVPMAGNPLFVPLMYAWIYFLTGQTACYWFASIMFYFLLGGSSYLLSKNLFESQTMALSTVFISMLSPVTLAVLFGFTLYPDLPLALFVCTSMLYLVKILKGKTEAWNFLLFGVSLLLMSSTKEIGLVISYFFLTFILLCMDVRFKKALFVSFFLLPLYTVMPMYPQFLQKLPLLIFYSLLLLIIVKGASINVSVGIKKASVSTIPLIPAIIFFLYWGLKRGIWFYTFIADASLLRVYQEFSEIVSEYYVQVSATLIDLLRLDDIFLRFSFIIYIPLIVSWLIFSFKKRKPETSYLYIIIIMFLCIFLWAPESFYPSLASPDVSCIRRYVYFLPLLSVLSAEGFFNLFNAWNAGKGHVNSNFSLLSFVTYNMLSTGYILERIKSVSPYPLNNLFNISELRASLIRTYAGIFDIFVLIACLFFCFELATVLGRLQRIYIGLGLRSKKYHVKLNSLILLSLTVFNLFIIPYYLQNPLREALQGNTEMRYWLPSNMDELVRLFNGVKDQDAVLGYQKNFLITFSDRKVVDNSVWYGFSVLKEVFENATNLDECIFRLKTRSIKYIVVPTNKETIEYKVFNEFRKRFPVFDNLFESEYLIPLKSLSDYKVYKVATHEEYEEYLKYLFNFEENPLVISDDNQSGRYLSTIKNISISDSLDVKIKGNNCLKIEISPYLSKKHEYIIYKFQSPVNLSNKDFISLYWYGNNTGITISLRFETGDYKNQYSFSFTDSWVGWARLIIPLSNFKCLSGSPDWNNITAISFVFYERVDIGAVFYLDKITADDGVTDYYIIPLEKLTR